MDNDIEIYKQRYETYRHLDKLRWQMLQIGVSAGTALLIFGKDENSNPFWWVWGAVGIVLIITGLSMSQINKGIRKNGNILRKFGESVGDKDMPKNKKFKGVSSWISIVMTLAGIFFVLLSVYFILYA